MVTSHVEGQSPPITRESVQPLPPARHPPPMSHRHNRTNQHRTTPRWAVALLMALAALSVVAWIPISRALRVPDERAVVLYQLSDLVTRERDSYLAGTTLAADGPDAMRSAAALRHWRHVAIDQLLTGSGAVVPGDLVPRIRAFQALIDQQLRFEDEAQPLTARAQGLEQVRRDYADLVSDLETGAATAAADGRASDAWESLVLFGFAMAAGIVVLVLFMVLQRRNAALEFGAGRRVALEGEQRRLRALIGASHDLIVVIDAEGRISWASPSVATFLGIPEDQVIGFAPTDLVHPDDLPTWRWRSTGLRSGADSPVRVECRIRPGGQDAEDRWVEIVATNAIREPGIGGLILTGRDITEQRMATDELETRERELRELMEHVNGVFYRAELGGRSVDLRQPPDHRDAGLDARRVDGRPGPVGPQHPPR